jgi:NAD(P)-dependent dehydrogenase (short-subunit alcohol dehydrogenase family)
VNAVAPGPVWTPLEVSGGLLEGMVETFGEGKPIGGRPGQPAELASLYVLLASDEPGYSSGQVFGATGGIGGLEPDSISRGGSGSVGETTGT